MAWEWVAPTATAVVGATGVFFTWFTGAQARSQAERLARRTEEAAERSRPIKEQRDAYLTALYYSQLDLRRAKYERKGKLDKLREVEAKWPKSERVRLYLEAFTAVEAFGSEEMRKIVSRWREAEMATNEERMRGFYDEFLEQARREIGPERSS